MAAAAAGIFSHHLAAGQTLTGKSASPMANATTGTSGTDSSTDSSDDSSTISANDFLTLLVTEMQNQDPTADTDPNEYINQLVQVNSLEQLIDINQNLTTALGDPGSSGSTTPASVAKSAGAASAGPAAPAAQVRASAQHKGVGMAAAQNAASSLGSSGHTSSGLTSSGLNSAGQTAAKSTASKHAPGNLSVPDAQASAKQVGHALNGKSHSRSIAGSQSGANGRSFTRRP